MTTDIPSKFRTAYYFKCTYCGKVSYSDTSESPSMCGRCLCKTAHHDVKGDKQKINPEYVKYLEAKFTKAKEIIKDLLSCLYSVEYDRISDLEEAEQFLKETGK